LNDPFHSASPLRTGIAASPFPVDGINCTGLS
jgi:hypothetical protein